MDDVRVDNVLRAIRIRKHLRQSDVARRARVTRDDVSNLERGALSNTKYGVFVAVATCLGIRAEIRLRWQGGEVDRVLNQGHADLHESIIGHLATIPGWTWRPEVSFSIYGERGVIDILAWHAATRSLVVIELKTELVDPQDLAGTMSRRVRLASEIAREYGWKPATVSAWVVLPEGSTNRRRVERHSGLLRSAFPSDGRSLRKWLRAPAGRISALSFWSEAGSGRTRRTTGQLRRVRAAR